jgi:hypothetical protein
MLLQPFKTNIIEQFANPNDIFESPDIMPMPTSTQDMTNTSNIIPPLSNYNYNNPTMMPITLAPTSSPMDAMFKEMQSASSKAFNNYKNPVPFFGQTGEMPSASPSASPFESPIPTAMSSQELLNPPITEQTVIPKFSTNEPMIESFYGSKIENLKNEKLLLKSVFYGLLFYILANGKLLAFTSKYLPKFDPLVIHTIVFVLIIIIFSL